MVTEGNKPAGHFMSDLIVSAGAALEQAVIDHPELEEGCYINRVRIFADMHEAKMEIISEVERLRLGDMFEIKASINDHGTVMWVQKSAIPVFIATTNPIMEDKTVYDYAIDPEKAYEYGTGVKA